MGESTGNACGPTIAARRGAPRESARLGRDRRRGAGGTAPVFEVGPSDPVAHTRACEPLPASAFPEVPAGYRHRLGRVAGLADRYTALPRFFEGRSAAIARDIQRARTEKEARRRAEAARAAKPRPNEGESGG